MIPLRKYNRRALLLCVVIVVAFGLQSSHTLWHHHEPVIECNHAHETEHHWHTAFEDTHECWLCSMVFSNFTLPQPFYVSEKVIKSVRQIEPQFYQIIFYASVYLFSSLRAPPFML